jgi:dihydrofolate reductase
MSSTGRVRVYVAMSLDGYIAGPDDDLSWLPEVDETQSDAGAVGFEQFIADVGALLMGRRTFDVVMSFDADWPYGDRPVLVATHRPLDPPGLPGKHVRAASGDIVELIASAREAAGGKDVYLDGGILVGQALDANLVDELILTVVPVVLGGGAPLFAGVTQQSDFEFTGTHRYGGGLVQLHARPRR